MHMKDLILDVKYNLLKLEVFIKVDVYYFFKRLFGGTS